MLRAYDLAAANEKREYHCLCFIAAHREHVELGVLNAYGLLLFT